MADFIILIPVLVFSVIIHEVAHGIVAEKYGDPTARLMGRITLNPIPHIDPIMTIFVPALLIISKSPIIFGGAKPVPVNPFNLRNPKRDMMFVALSGPTSNIILAFLGAVVFRFVDIIGIVPEFITHPLYKMIAYTVIVNCVLAVFNMLPIPPLDGSKILMGILPYPYSEKFARIEPYGFFIIIAVIFFLQSILWALMLIPLNISGFIGGRELVIQMIRIFRGY